MLKPTRETGLNIVLVYRAGIDVTLRRGPCCPRIINNARKNQPLMSENNSRSFWGVRETNLRPQMSEYYYSYIYTLAAVKNRKNLAHN